MRRLSKLLLATIPGILLLVVAARTVQGAPPIWAPPALEQIIEEGLTRNQEILSLEAQVASLTEEISFAGSLDDPRLGMALLNLPADTFRFDQEPMTQKQLFVAQKVPWFGKLGLRSQSQALRAKREQALLDAKRFEIARQLASAYYELGFTARSEEINERLISMVNQLLRVAETRYAAGRGLQQDLLQAQVELSKLLDEKIMLERQRRTLEDRINELLNRESFAPITPARQLNDPNLVLEVEALKQQSLQGNPWLRVREAEVDQAAVEIQLAKKDYWPDPDFMVAYGQRDDSRTGEDWADFVSASVVVSIPLWQKNRQDSKLAVKYYQSLVDALPHRLDALANEIRNMQENYRLVSDALILQAAQWSRSSLAAYEVGKVEFSTVINAHIRLLRFELQADRYLFSIYQKRAELEEVLGGVIQSSGASNK
jgi:cobalt-zinc-cadmium efflux system outer membrane protein